MRQEPSRKNGEVVSVVYTLIILFSVYSYWGKAWDWLGKGYSNLEYLQYGCIALTVVAISKMLIKQEGSDFAALMGSRPSKECFSDIFYVFLLIIISAIGIWGTLIWVGAQVDLPWTIESYSLISTETFARVAWRKDWLVVSSLCTVVLGPIIEELLLRGFILRRLRQKYSVRTALVISAAIFSILHFNVHIVSSFVHGLLYGLLAIKYSSLYIPMMVHGAYNLTIDVLSHGFGFFLAVDLSKIASVDYWWLEFIIAACSVTLIVLYIRKETSQTRISCKPHALLTPVPAKVDASFSQVWRA